MPKAGGKTCAGCLSASYCSRKCQVAGFPAHKGECHSQARTRAEAAAAEALLPESSTMLAVADTFVRSCHKPGCGADESETVLSACKGCAEVRYCSRECQKSDWARHKSYCKRVQKAANSPEARAMTVEAALEAVDKAEVLMKYGKDSDGLDVLLRAIPCLKAK